MKKQKKQLIMMTCALLFGASFALRALAATYYGNAIVSWVAPTTDEGGGALGGGTSDLAGYRVYYNTSAINCPGWNAADQATRQADTGTLLPATYSTVTGGTSLKFAFASANSLTLGSAYNFAVVAYDTSGNLSKCATAPDGTTTSVGKTVSYPADISSGTANGSLHKVDGADLSVLHANYSLNTAKPGNAADINGDNYVNGADYSFLHAEYGQSF